MYYIKTKTPGAAWIKAISYVMRNGHIVYDGRKKLKEVLNIVIQIDQPYIEDFIIKRFGDKKMLRWMKNNFLRQLPIENWGYSYGQRLRNYRRVDQLAGVIKKLKINSESKSAIICFIYPPGDVNHTPCIVALDIKIRNKKLLATAFLRSQDVVKKSYADIISIGKILDLIAQKLQIEIGSLLLHVVSLHAYEDDFARGREILKLQKI